jgi:hypothetical protein
MNNQSFLQNISKICDWLPGLTNWLKPSQADALVLPADLEVERSGVCFIDGQDRLDYLWYRLHEAEGGREYARYRVVRLLQLAFLPQEACSDPGLLQKMRTVLRGFLWVESQLFISFSRHIPKPPIPGGDRSLLRYVHLCAHARRGLLPIQAKPGGAQRGHEWRLPPDPPAAPHRRVGRIDLPELPRNAPRASHRGPHRPA